MVATYSERLRQLARGYRRDVDDLYSSRWEPAPTEFVCRRCRKTLPAGSRVFAYLHPFAPPAPSPARGWCAEHGGPVESHQERERTKLLKDAAILEEAAERTAA